MLLGYDTSSLGNRIQKFPANILSSVSSIEMALHCLKTTEFDYAANYRHVPEERNS
jgi:hypothetical protein